MTAGHRDRRPGGCNAAKPKGQEARRTGGGAQGSPPRTPPSPPAHRRRCGCWPWARWASMRRARGGSTQPSAAARCRRTPPRRTAVGSALRPPPQCAASASGPPTATRPAPAHTWGGGDTDTQLEPPHGSPFSFDHQSGAGFVAPPPLPPGRFWVGVIALRPPPAPSRDLHPFRTDPHLLEQT